LHFILEHVLLRMMECAARLEIVAVPGVPVVGPGIDLGVVVDRALRDAAIVLQDGDVLVVASKVMSRAEGRFVDLASIRPSGRAVELGRQVGKDARIVELILRESIAVSRWAPGVLVVRHRLGFVCANASIDFSNAQPPSSPAGSGPWALLLPESPDASAERLRRHFSPAIGVVVTDSLGRPFRLGTVGAAVGIAGLPALWDRRGESDLCGRVLEQTITAVADQVAAAADLVAGQADEARGVVLVRGLRFTPGEHHLDELLRPPAQDLYA
jgi:coenzyme F420-0:L-glutamate ligase / coenzyme F420-1:gamma-L-glutamate ligase